MLSTNDEARYPHDRNRAASRDQLPGLGMKSYLVRAKAGKPIGPLPANLILRGVELRRVPFDAEVREEGTAEWVPLASVDEFYDAMGLDDEQTGQNERPAFDPVGEGEGDEATRILSSLWSDEPTGVAGQRQAAPPGLPPPPAPGVAPTTNTAPQEPRLPPLPHPPNGAPQPKGAPQPRPGPLPVPRPPAGPPLANRPVPLPSPLSAGPPAAPTPPASAPQQAPRLTPEASELMDADEDDDDVKIVRSISGAEAPRNSRPSFQVRPAAGDPNHPSSRPPPAYVPDRPDELTAPAQRLVRQQEIIRRALAYITTALVVALLVLVAVLLLR